MTTSFVEKYRPKDYKEIVGQAKAVEIIKKFLEEFPKKKALVLYGPAGTGKTSIVLAAAKENNYEIMELNSSDLRNRQKLEETLKPASEQKSLFKKSKIILMDEVDGVTGTDIGGIPELVRVIQTTRFPIIMTCNDVWQSKLSPVREKSIIIELKPLDLGTIVSVLAQVAEKENVKKDSQFFKQIAIKSQGDLRAALNDLQSYLSGEDIFVDITEKRDVEDTIFNILRKILKERGESFFTFSFSATCAKTDTIVPKSRGFSSIIIDFSLTGDNLDCQTSLQVIIMGNLVVCITLTSSGIPPISVPVTPSTSSINIILLFLNKDFCSEAGLSVSSNFCLFLKSDEFSSIIS